MRRPLYKPQVVINNKQEATQPTPITPGKPMHRVVIYTYDTRRIDGYIKDHAKDNVEVVVIYNIPSPER